MNGRTVWQVVIHVVTDTTKYESSSWWFANDGVASLGIMRPPISPGVINVAPTGPSHT